MNISNLDGIKSFITSVVELLAVIIPIAVTGYYTITKQLNSKLKQLELRTNERSNNIFKDFSYKESINSLVHIKSIINMFCDKSAADIVCYYQIEDGTVAASKLHNMYLTCVSESDRYTTIPKYVSNIQRVPAARVLTYLSAILNSKSGLNIVLPTNKLPDYELDLLYPKECRAFRVRGVRNDHGYLVGYVEFRYNSLVKDITDEDLSKLSNKELLELIPDINDIASECKVAIEAELVRFNNVLKAKKVELNLTNESIDTNIK